MKQDSAPNDAAPAEAREPALDEERVVRCKRCDATVTKTSDAIAIEGKHLHHFVNPAGVAFDVRCFGEASGCSPYGDASTFFSWFSGHAWRIAVCAKCGVHLGWRFEGPSSNSWGGPPGGPHDANFHGLITDRIVETA